MKVHTFEVVSPEAKVVAEHLVEGAMNELRQWLNRQGHSLTTVEEHIARAGVLFGCKHTVAYFQQRELSCTDSATPDATSTETKTTSGENSTPDR